jgi:tyrosyl-tRNA synthetase
MDLIGLVIAGIVARFLQQPSLIESPTMTHDLINELTWRGLLYQTTDEDRLRAHLAAERRTVYCGFDPTADSLTIGNLVPIMLLAWFQRLGHRPVVVLGGGTGMIGDPSGKEAERQLRTLDEIRANMEGQRRIFERLLDFDAPDTAAVMVNNHDWLGELGWIEALRDIGKHFSVNQMVQRDSVRERLENREQGISYTEFSYILLQAYDFLLLYRKHGVTVQAAGSDQWGNIVSGVDLIRRLEGHGRDGTPLAFGLTAPLVTKSDGGKFGKTESGAIWLTDDRTSAYAFYQFWLNASDADVLPWLRIFTFLDHDEIEALERAHAEAPHRREAQRALARAVTALVHGTAAAERAEAAARALFSGAVAELDLATLEEAFADVPASEHAREELAGEGIALLEVLPTTSLVASKGEARKLLKAGALSVNGTVVALEKRLTPSDLLHDRVILLRRGKKTWHLVRWS